MDEVASDNSKVDGKTDLKICGVCGDKALGYNFNAVTCESCKAFFRRNALAKKDFRCPFNESCAITTITRRFCQKCRLDKCFAIGMRKEYIMTDQDKELKKQKIQENKAKKRTNSNGFKQGFKKIKRDTYKDESFDYVEVHYSSEESKCKKVICDQSSRYIPNNINVVDYSNTDLVNRIYEESSSNGNTDSSDDGQLSNGDSMIRTMLNTTPKNQDFHEEDTNQNSITNNNQMNCNNNVQNINSNTINTARDVLQDIQKIPIEANSIESILCEAIKLEFEAYTSLGSTTRHSRELNDAERAKLNELIVANKALLTPLDEDLSNFIGDDINVKPEQALFSDPALVDVINLTAIAIRRLIKMAKKINAFKNMCQEDQVALLKGGCTEMMILRSAMNYDVTKQTWKIPHSQECLSSLKADVLKKAKGNIYQEHEKFIKTFDPKWRADENIVLILCAISLFTPDRPRVVHQDVIKLEQNSYYYLLRRYLESIYPGCEAKSAFLKLIQKISELHKVNEEVINCYLDVNPSDVEPLLIEIFDLKH